MIFKTERQLQTRLAQLVFDSFPEYPISFARREVRVGGCIPDLVSIHFDKDPNIHPWPSRWSYRHSFTVWLLRYRPLSVDEIASAFFEPANKVKPIVDHLISNQIAFMNKSNKISLNQHIQRDFQANVVAVEAKLKDWRQALNQAIRYKDFANTVFVAMDASAIPHSKAQQDMFRAEKIGLCAVLDFSHEWVVNPVIREDGVGHEKEYLLMSAAIPTTQRLWARRNSRNASNQA